MTIYEVPECSDSLLQTILTIWEASVRATHHFLSDAEIVRIREYVPQAVRAVEHLVLAEDASGTAVAFLGAEGHRLEMLFLSPSERGKGIGRQLLQCGVQHYGIREVTVNEQNPQERDSMSTWALKLTGERTAMKTAILTRCCT
ncbi:GNAT family N-acetyltransferase [uncultured Ruminococcus sp.]|uniref:GNAT family N-acetyltransferase n=1 Tax=uncultured Ruminococcus sp. TaxID=165186 RepID=UPI0034A0718D